MSPRLIAEDRCPHCRAQLPEPKPRVCPECAGSLQQRYVKAGCLTSAPKLLAIAIGSWCAIDALRAAARWLERS